jgi:hypothetical protein
VGGPRHRRAVRLSLLLQIVLLITFPVFLLVTVLGHGYVFLTVCGFFFACFLYRDFASGQFPNAS